MMQNSIIGKLSDKVKSENLPVFRIVEIVGSAILTAELNPANDSNNIYSVSKSYTSFASGLLFDRGLLDYKNSVYELFYEDYPEDINDTWKNVTIKMVFDQTVGINRFYLDMDSEDLWGYPYSDLIRNVLREPFIYEPGTHFCYSDSNYYLAARIVEKLGGTDTSKLLWEALFNPLKYQSHAWAADAFGHCMGATGLFLRTADMAKFGRLLRDGGVYDGKRIISKEWIDLATNHKTKDGCYSLGFWIQPGEGHFCCSGAFDQLIDINLNRDRVVAWSSYDKSGKVRGLRDLLREN